MVRRINNNYMSNIAGGTAPNNKGRLSRKGKLNITAVPAAGENMYTLIDENGRTYEAAFMFPNGTVVRQTELSGIDAEHILRTNEYLGFSPNSEVFMYPEAPKLIL